MPFDVLNGNPGYINLLDACNAWQLVHQLREATGLVAATSFKHVSPAGAALAVPLTVDEATAYEVTDPAALSPAALAYTRARNADPMSSFGDFVAISDEVDEGAALVLKVAVSDGIIAPGYTERALEILKAKKKGNFVILQADAGFEASDALEFREVMGMAFLQKRNVEVREWRKENREWRMEG
jgi:phosphoribosylaminoimidazolecarboxamide formyltransferase/IMP cyclohydrolase